MDPLTAVSLASSVIQFVSFGCDLFAKGKEISHSSARTTEEYAELGLVSQNLSVLSTNLDNALSAASNAPGFNLNDEDKGLLQLAKASTVVSDKLAAALDALKGRGPAGGKWKSLYAALKHVLGSDKIQDLESRLDRLRQQLNLQLMVSLRHEQNSLSQKLEILAANASRSDAGRKEQLKDIATQIKTMREQRPSYEPKGKLLMQLAKQHLKGEGDQGEVEEQLAASHPESSLESLPLGLVSEMRVEIESMSEYMMSTSRMIAENRILQSLYFNAISYRQGAIPEAHTKTFAWIFDPNSPTSVRSDVHGRYTDWLKSSNGIFWVSGKAGSGKSTLMKFLYSHPSTDQLLRTWAGQAELVTVCFYFWSAGSSMQKSLQGLLQSLLYRILTACPELIQSSCPSRWIPQALHLQDEPWSASELLEVIMRVAQDSQVTRKFCFFIDGLDEFEGYHRDVNDVMNKFAEHANIKLCVSSRPWNIFEDAFGQNPLRKLYLHELTYKDIQLYVRQKLRAHPNFVYSSEQDPDYATIVQQTVDNSQGIFLWVYLVVRSLYDGLDNSDSLQLLRKRLDTIPRDLEQFFLQIIQSVDTVYQQSLAETFTIALHADEPLPLMLYSIIEQPITNQKVKPLNSKAIKQRTDNMRRRVNGQSKGLLEITTRFSEVELVFLKLSVDFLHRTLRDYLKMDVMKEYMKRNVGADFDAELTLSRSYLSLLRVMPTSTESSMISSELYRDMFLHARHYEARCRRCDPQLLEGLQSLVNEHRKEQHSLTKKPSSELTPQSTAVKYAVVYQLREAVTYLLDSDPLLSTRCSLISLAMYPDRGWWELPAIGVETEDKVAMVKLIARHNATPGVWSSYILGLDALVDPSSALSEDEQGLAHVLQNRPDPEVLAKQQGKRIWRNVLRAIASTDVFTSPPDVQNYYATLLCLFIVDNIFEDLHEVTRRDDFNFIKRNLNTSAQEKLEDGINLGMGWRQQTLGNSHLQINVQGSQVDNTWLHDQIRGAGRSKGHSHNLSASSFSSMTAAAADAAQKRRSKIQDPDAEQAAAAKSSPVHPTTNEPSKSDHAFSIRRFFSRRAKS